MSAIIRGGSSLRRRARASNHRVTATIDPDSDIVITRQMNQMRKPMVRMST